MENRVSGEALFRSQPMKRSVGDGSCLYQSFGHYISQLVDGINLMDIDFTLGIAFSLHMFTEEVEHHRKELALGSNPETELPQQGLHCCLQRCQTWQ